MTHTADDSAYANAIRLSAEEIKAKYPDRGRRPMTTITMFRPRECRHYNCRLSHLVLRKWRGPRFRGRAYRGRRTFRYQGIRIITDPELP